MELKTFYPFLCAWLLMASTTEAGSVTQCDTSLDDPNFCSWSDRSVKDWQINWGDLCGGGSQAGGGQYTINQDGWAVQIQLVLQAGVSEENCNNAMNDLWNNCIVGGHASGTWSTDPSNQEWYWAWLDPGEYICEDD